MKNKKGKSESRDLVERICHEQKITQADIAERLGITYNTLRNWTVVYDEAPTLALVALRAIYQERPDVAGSEALSFASPDLPSVEKVLLCNAYTHIGTAFKKEIKNWNNSKLARFAASYPRPNMEFKLMIDRGLLMYDESTDQKVNYFAGLSDDALDALYKSKVAQAAKVVMKELATRLEARG